jgi:hypothetical protein
MQSFIDRRRPALDTTQPSIRHIQDLIRERTTVAIQMVEGSEFEGVLRWQDLQYFGLQQGEDRPLTLLNRNCVSVVRVLA